MSKGKVLTSDRLKSMLPDMMVFKWHVADANTTKTTGIYGITGSAANVPTTGISAAILEVIVLNSVVYQRITDMTGIYYRVFKSSWSAWRKIADSVMGGVICCTLSAREQKGGQSHEYGSKSSYGREAERVATERNGAQRTMRGPEYMQDDRDLVSGFQHEKQVRTAEHGLRHSGGDCAAQEWSQYRNLPAHHLMAMHVVRDTNRWNGLLAFVENSDLDPSVNLLAGKEVAA